MTTHSLLPPPDRTQITQANAPCSANSRPQHHRWLDLSYQKFVKAPAVSCGKQEAKMERTIDRRHCPYEDDKSPVVHFADRLVWARLPEASKCGAPYWWLAVLFKNIDEFESFTREESKERNDNTYLLSLAVSFAEKTKEDVPANSTPLTTRFRGETKGNSSCFVVRYLGRPLQDVELASGGECLDFVRNLYDTLKQAAFQPGRFSGSTRNFELYMSFHRGLDQAVDLIHSKAGCSTTVPLELPSVRALKVWFHKQQGAAVTTQNGKYYSLHERQNA